MTQLEQVVLGASASSVQVAGLVSSRFNFTDEPDYFEMPGTVVDFDYIGFATCITVQSDGKVLVAGDSGLFDGGEEDNYSVVKRFNADGTADTTFNTSAKFYGTIYALALQSSGKVIVGGNFVDLNSTSVYYIARLTTNGTHDTDFDNGGFDDYVHALTVDIDDSVIVGGEFAEFDGYSSPGLAKLDGLGVLDEGFADNVDAVGYDSVWCITPTSDGEYFIGGSFTNRICKINANGTEDGGFSVGAGFDNDVYSIAIQKDGKVVVGGEWSTYKTINIDNGLCRLEDDGTFDATFNLGTTGFDGDWWAGVQAVALQSSGKILIGGFFVTLDGKLCNRLVRLNSDGSRDVSFGSNIGANDGVMALTVKSDDTVFVAGYFTQYGGKVLTTDFNFGNNSISYGCMKLTANGGLIGQPIRYNFYRVGVADGCNVWDSGMYFNTNYTQTYATINGGSLDEENCIPFTHSNVIVCDDSSVGYMYYDYASDKYNYYYMPSDGRIKNANDYFGNGSRYFTNMFPGLFVLAANNMTINEFNIYGGTEQDGNGECLIGSFEFKVNGFEFAAFYKSSSAGGDPTVNQLIIVDGIEAGITQNVPDPVDDDGYGDTHVLTGLSGRKELYVLVFAKENEAEVTETYMKLIANSFVKSFVSPEVIKSCSNKGCGTSVGKVCKIGTNSCTCAKTKFFYNQCSNIQQSLGICSAVNGAYVPAITVCNQRLF